MAINASKASLKKRELIDLTGDDDIDEEEKRKEEEKGGFVVLDGFRRPLPSMGQTPSTPVNDEQSRPQSQTKSNSRLANANANANANVTPSAVRSKHKDKHTCTPSKQPTPSNRPLQSSSSYTQHLSVHDRPPKRRKLQDGASHKVASPAVNTKTLTKCLQFQVFPHLERAVKHLDRKVYDVEKLGAKVIWSIADSDFEQRFHDNNGRLPPDTEALVITRIHELVGQFTKGNEFRLSQASLEPISTPAPKPSLQPVASILPSIEIPPSDTLPDRLPTSLPAKEDRDAGNNINDKEGDYVYEDVGKSEQVESWHVQTPPPKPKPKNKTLATPQQVRTRLKATQWQSGKPYEFKKEGSPIQVRNSWFGLPLRPYLPARTRQQIAAGVNRGRPFHLQPDDLREPSVYHVDFSDEEIRYIRYIMRCLRGKSATKPDISDLHDLRYLLKKYGGLRDRFVEAHGQKYARFKNPPSSLVKRSLEDVQNFLDDAEQDQVGLGRKLLYIKRDNAGARSDFARTDNIPNLLLAREIAGNRLGATRRYLNFHEAFKCSREDYMEPRIEWTNCAGDLMTFSWMGNSTDFVCGTTTHSDSHNQQYNKPGNLLFGSTVTKNLLASPEHRIPRPVVAHGDNALASMRESQDPWLFTSVVSSDYDPAMGFAFTASYDNTVKVWDGSSRLVKETWHHEGRVNFVLANKQEDCSRVATAADVPTRAVRVYQVERRDNVAGSYTYDEYSCKRVHGEDYIPSDKWAYFPSAIRWGILPSMKHLLLIGYSPRSLSGDDNDIPEDKSDTGELCLWDTTTKTEVKVNSAATANVFEVAWHPSRPSFAAATSASQTSEKIEEHVRTQIRLFELNELTGQYTVVKKLDCPAIDINELLIRPNSTLYSYVVAGCTDGKAYVWDSAWTDDPMCVLDHGEPVEEFIGDREHEDVGVKFIAWATTTDRLYTGSSDGVVKIWNIRHGNGVLVRDLIEVAAPITAGAFSPDFTKLLIGDGSGRVYLLDLDGDDEDSSNAASSGFLNLQLDGKQRAIRRPRPITLHKDISPPHPPPSHGGNNPEWPEESDLESRGYGIGQKRAKQYLNKQQLILHPNPTIGALQGPAYAETALYRAEAHIGRDVEYDLISGYEFLQWNNQESLRGARIRKQRDMDINKWPKSKRQLHKLNRQLDLGIDSLDARIRSQLLSEGAELDVSPLDLDYETE